MLVTVFDKDTYGINKEIRFANILKLFGLFIGISLILLTAKWVVEGFAYLSLLILMFYNNKRGKYKMKYLFYVFYPLHLLIIYFISLI